MTKIAAALASMLILGSISSTTAFAQLSRHDEIVRRCEAMAKPEPRQHHSHLAIEACVQRLEQGY